jgi:hypothetical protein
MGLNLNIGFDSTELDDVDLEALILAKRERERERALVAALREEAKMVQAQVARATAAGDKPYSTDAGHPLNTVPPGVTPWGRPLPTGNDLLPRFESALQDVYNALERLGEHVE